MGKKGKAEKAAKEESSSSTAEIKGDGDSSTKRTAGTSSAGGDSTQQASDSTPEINMNDSSGLPAEKTSTAIANLLKGNKRNNRKVNEPKKSGRQLNVSIVRPTAGAKGNSSASSASSKDELRWTGWGSPHLESSGSLKEGSALSDSISASEGADERLTYGVASLTGRRQTNEDESVAQLNMGFKKEKVGFFGVFDGHGGPDVSDMLKKEMPRMLKSRTKIPNEAGLRKAIKDVFLDVDEKIIRRKMKGGSTGVVALVTDDKLIVGSVGDSRCLVCDNGKKYEMTRDHEIDDSEEEERILQAGYRPYVDSDNELRIEGLNMSRSFGDIELKKNGSLGMTEQAVIAVPRIRCMELRHTLEFMVVACDGVFEVMTNNDVVRYVRKSLKSLKTAEQTALGLAKRAIKKGSNDNVTVVIVDFMHNASGKPWKTAPPASPKGSTDSSRSEAKSATASAASGTTAEDSSAKAESKSKSASSSSS